MGGRQSLWSELKSRHVVRAALAHIVFFWLLVQVADVVLPYIGVVDEPVRWAIVAGVALFPVTLLVAWFIEHPWHRHTSSRLAIDLAVILGIGVVTFTWVKNNLPQVIHDRTSIAVLPFDYSDDNPMGRTVSRALALEINSLLMKSRSIDVIGYESASSNLLRGLDIAGILDALQVEHILSGVISTASASSIEVHLHDANGAEIWSSQIDYDLEDLNAVQERIASEVQGRLGETGAGSSVAEVSAGRCPMPFDPNALERYYTARNLVELRTSSEESKAELQQAVDLYRGLIGDYPDFAEAHSGLAWAIFIQAGYDREGRDMDAMHQERRALAARAYELCDSLGEALVMMSNPADHPNPWINEEQNLALWIDMQGDATEALDRYTTHLAMTGRQIERVNVAERNYRLHPLSVRAMHHLMLAYQAEDRMDEAVALEKRAHDLGSNIPPYASNMVARNACQEDLECVLGNLPPPIKPFEEQLRTVYMEPSDEAGQERAIETAMQLLEMSGGMLLNWFNGSSCRYEHLEPLFYRLWDWHVENSDAFNAWWWPNTWKPHCSHIWEDPRFNEVLEQAGLVEYYRSKGWPDACRPDDEGDTIVCSLDVRREKRLAAALDVPVSGRKAMP